MTKKLATQLVLSDAKASAGAMLDYLHVTPLLRGLQDVSEVALLKLTRSK